jgi:hypothetical protein
MEKNYHKILKHRINPYLLVSTTSRNWYDKNRNLIPWDKDGSIYVGPKTGDIIFNISGGTVSSGYYRWNEPIRNTWNLIQLAPSKETDETDKTYLNRVLSKNFDDLHLPIYLDSTAYEMGGMVGFDGDIIQVEQLVNFHYEYLSDNTIRLYNTVNRDVLKIIKDETFTITWGDGNTDTIDVSLNDDLSYKDHTYSVTTGYTVSIELDNSWTQKRLSKKINIPPSISVQNPDGSFPFDYETNTVGTFTLPYTTGITFTQEYINDFDVTDSGTFFKVLDDNSSCNNNGESCYENRYELNNPTTSGITYSYKTINSCLDDTIMVTGVLPSGQTLNICARPNTLRIPDPIIYFAATGRSRKSELKRYGENTYQGTSTGSDNVGNYTGYTIDNLSYKDYEDGITMITGSTTNFYKEEVFNQMLTRNEHFIGFIDEPTIYSDVFVERGKQGVLEMNLRLGEIDNLGELDIYGNGFFQVKKQ